jgi:resorcinol 4-hydroxylase (FADH2)
MTSFFPLQAQQEVWDDPDNLLAVSYTPSPKVEVVDGGPWASGVDSAAWLILSVLIPGKDTPPTLAWCLVPVRDVIVDQTADLAKCPGFTVFPRRFHRSNASRGNGPG